MPKFARLVVPNCPHHITQRGNRRQRVFFCDSDKQFYLRLIRRLGMRFRITFLAYCLMDNHVHLIAIPPTKESLAHAIGEAHRLYTTAINIREEWKGYLWQGRFSSFPLSEFHLFLAMRYIELNPVRAKIVQKPEDYPWSSTRAHLGLARDPLIPNGQRPLNIIDWRAYLDEACDPQFPSLFKIHQKTGRPMGDNDYLRNLEILTGRKLLPQKRGRKKLG